MSAPFYVAQRQVGTVNEIVPVYIQSTTSPFLGLQNITISSGVSASWFRSDATGASSIAIISSAAMGSYSSGNWTQVNSTVAPGWYEFGVPSVAFSSGRWMGITIFSSSNAFSPQPLFYELTKTDNQTYVSSQTLSTAVCRIYSDGFVTTAAGVLSVGAVGVSSFGLPVGVSSFNTGLQVGVSSFSSRVGVSSFNLDVGVSSMNTGLQVGVSSFNSRVGVSSFNLPVGVSSFDVGLQVGVSSFSSRVGVSSFGLPVGVSSFNVPLQVGVSSFGITVGVSSVQDKSDYGVSTVTGLNTSLIDAAITSRLAGAAYTAPDNTNIANIQAKTSSLTYTNAGQVDANIQSINDVTIVGDGSGTPFNV